MYVFNNSTDLRFKISATQLQILAICLKAFATRT